MKALLALLPEIVFAIKQLVKMYRDGKTKKEINQALENIESAFEMKEAKDRAKALNDNFSNDRW